MKKLSAMLLAAAMCLSLAACGQNSSSPNQNSGTSSDGGFDKMSIKVSYSTGEQGMDGIACAKFVELVSEATGGAVTIEPYGNAQLAGGDMDRMVELLIQGGAYAVSYTHLDVYKRQGERTHPVKKISPAAVEHVRAHQEYSV